MGEKKVRGTRRQVDSGGRGCGCGCFIYERRNAARRQNTGLYLQVGRLLLASLGSVDVPAHWRLMGERGRFKQYGSVGN